MDNEREEMFHLAHNADDSNDWIPMWILKKTDVRTIMLTPLYLLWLFIRRFLVENSLKLDQIDDDIGINLIRPVYFRRYF